MIEKEFYSNNLLLRGRFLRSQKAKDKEKLVVIATGDGKSGSKSSSYEVIMPKLLESGIAVFIFDFAGQGYSEGDHKRLTIQTGIDNLHAAIKTVHEEPWVDKDCIGILGSSYGAKVTINYLGNKKNNIKAIALKSPACLYPEVYELLLSNEELINWEKNNYEDKVGRYWECYLEGFDHNTYKSAKNINTPCLITHGGADTVVPPVHSFRLKACLKGEVKLEILEGVNHGYKENDSLETAAKLYLNWFSEKL